MTKSTTDAESRQSTPTAKPKSTTGAYLFHWVIAAVKGDICKAIMLCEILRVFEPIPTRMKNGVVGQRPIARMIVRGMRFWRRSISQLAKDTHMSRDQARRAIYGHRNMLQYYPKSGRIRPNTFKLRAFFLNWARKDPKNRWEHILPERDHILSDEEGTADSRDMQERKEHYEMFGIDEEVAEIFGDGRYAWKDWTNSNTRWVATCRKRIRINPADTEEQLQMRLYGHNQSVARFLVEIHRSYAGDPRYGVGDMHEPAELPRVPATFIPWKTLDECGGDHTMAYVLSQLRWRWSKYKKFVWRDRVQYMPWMVASMARDMYLDRKTLDRKLKKLVKLGKISVAYHRIGWRSARGKEVQHIHLL